MLVGRVDGQSIIFSGLMREKTGIAGYHFAVTPTLKYI